MFRVKTVERCCYLLIVVLMVVLYVLIQDEYFLTPGSHPVSANLGSKLVEKPSWFWQRSSSNDPENAGRQSSNREKPSKPDNDEVYRSEDTSSYGHSLTILLYTNRLRTPLIYDAKCKVTRNKNSFSESRVVVFHAADFPLPDSLIQTRYKTEYADQIWVYYNLDSPLQTQHFKSHEMLFNWTITPLSKSDIPHGRGYYHQIEPRSSLDEYLVSKDKFIAFFADDCQAEVAKHYITTLQRYVDVDIFGRCKKLFPDSFDCRNNSYCKQLLSSYKFVLAFESMFCQDHITENYWNALLRGNIPVILAANLDTLIPGSFISVRDFPTVKDLAIYLYDAFIDEDASAKFFEWHRIYSLDFDPFDIQRTEKWLPDLCNLALKDDGSKQKNINISDFYGKEKNCPEKYTNQVYKIINSSPEI